MTYIPATSFEERANRLLQLRLRIRKIKNKYPYDEQDGRKKILNNLTWLIAIILMKMNIALAYNNKPETRPILRELIGLTEGDLITPLQTDIDLSRFCFVTLFQFQLENLMKILLKELKVKNIPTGFYKIANKLLVKIGIPDYNSKLDTLNALAYMRNCLHSNGIHINEKKSFNVNGLILDFLKNKPFHKGEWGEITHCANESITIIEEILDRPDIFKINGPIDEKYIPDLSSKK